MTSIVIISRGRRRSLEETIISLKENSNPDEIVVVESTNTPISLKGVKYIHIPFDMGNFSVQRNIGVKEASGDIIVFVDDETKVFKGWLEKMTEPIIKGETNMVFGAVFPWIEKKKKFLGFFEGVLGIHSAGLIHKEYSHRVSLFSTCNLAVKKEILIENPFDESLKHGAEDTELSIRLLKKYGEGFVLYKHDAVVLRKPKSFKSYLGWFIRRGKGDMDVSIKHKQIKWLILSSISLKFLPILLISILQPYFLLLFLMWYLYVLKKYGFALSFAKKINLSLSKSLLYFLLFPFFYTFVNLIFDTGRLLRFLK